MDKKLFSDFLPSDKLIWQEQVKKEIKKPASELNKDSRGTIRKTEPYYSSEEFETGHFELLHQYQKSIPGWLNMPEIKPTEYISANQKIHQAISSGAQAIFINAEAQILSPRDVSKLLHNVRTTEIPVFIKTGQNPNDIFNLLEKDSGYSIKGGIAHDYVASWMANLQPFDQTFKDIASLFKRTESMKHFYPLMVETHIFHNAGATPEQELAYLIGSLVFYLDKLTDTGISADLILKNIFFSVSVGTEYLTEIAKLRAARLLVGRIADAYGANHQTPFFHAKISNLYMANTLPHTNLLRTTSAAMSAVMGGCDALTIPAYDESFSTPSDFSDRIAQNISSILSNESYINQVADPAAGSYYIDQLSQDLADSAWSLFLDLENRGGLIACFESGYIQDEIDKSWQNKMQALEHGYDMVGVNKYQDKITPPLTPESVVLEEEFRNLPNRNLSTYWNNLHQ